MKLNILFGNEFRKLKIIELLYDNDDFLSLDVIVEHLKCSSKTVLSYLEEIQNELDFLKIIKLNNEFYLSFKSDGSISQVYYHYISQSPHFNFLISVFTENITSISDFADRLFVSSSTIYRIIHELNQTFKTFHLDICLTNNPIQIIGTERHIRYFFYTLFMTVAHSNIIKNSSYQKIDKYVSQLSESKLYVQHSYHDFLGLKNLIMVNYFRYCQGHKLNIQSQLSDVYQSMIDDTDFSASIKQLTNNLDIDFNQTTLLELFAPYSQASLELLTSYRFELYDTNYNRIQTSIQYLEKLIDELCQEFQIQISNKNQLIVSIHNQTIFSEYTGRYIYFVFDQNKIIKNLYYRDQEEFMLQCEKKLAGYVDLFDFNFPDEIIESLISVLLLNWHNLLIELNRLNKKVKVLIFDPINLAVANNLKTMIEYEFTKQIEISIWNGKLIDLNEEQMLRYDIIMSSIPLQVPSQTEFIQYSDHNLSLHLSVQVINALHTVRTNNIKLNTKKKEPN